MNLPRCFLFFFYLLQQIWFFFLDLLFPWYCVYCGTETKRQPLCSRCFNSISLNSGFICPSCKRRVSNPWHKPCHCSSPLYSLGTVGNYSDPILRTIIHKFKYNTIISLINPLSELLCTFLEESRIFKFLPQNKITTGQIIIIPIPLHKTKKRIRGFNQAELLAHKIAQHFQLSYSNKILFRIKNNKPQVEIKNRQLREANVKGIFAVRNSEKIQKKIIILVDDVYTTGATMKEAARVLKQAGAKKVIGIVIARG